MSDLIKRSDAIGALYKYSFVSKDVIEREINAIPQGEWIDDGFAHRCSICGKQGVGIEYYNYCPNCGADMRPKSQGTHSDSIIIDECAMKGVDDEA